MLLIETVEELKDVLFRIKSNGKSVGLVPTMGALHQGHLSLVQRARKENAAVICSIFVNPVQFNNTDDLKKYPRTLEEDINLISNLVDIVFAPTAEEIFPVPPTEKYSFGTLETVMEGAFRPGHFNGVAVIVKRLFDWIAPDKAYFGEKDFQQLAIIQDLVKQYQIKTQIVPCPIVREENGLAMSSRNRRLSEEEFQKASNIYKILQTSLSLADQTTKQIKEFVIREIAQFSEFKLDYFEIVNDTTLQPVDTIENNQGIVGCIAIYVGEVRLIDNIRYH
ncbi:MAG: pantoate--beta-alanine ligase [Bacteroidales bacterium]